VNILHAPGVKRALWGGSFGQWILLISTQSSPHMVMKSYCGVREETKGKERNMKFLPIRDGQLEHYFEK